MRNPQLSVIIPVYNEEEGLQSLFDRLYPALDKLGGTTWARAKGKVKKAMRDMAEELLKLYAQRKTAEGHAFPPDTQWQREFEDAFEYEETPDQARAIIEVKRDMERSRPMDRLICGDVGYGKTEVALRAAFKAVCDGKQVAVLVPTTVLAEQHRAGRVEPDPDRDRGEQRHVGLGDRLEQPVLFEEVVVLGMAHEGQVCMKQHRDESQGHG